MALPLIPFAIGAAAMYLLDPQQGRRRRALLRDRLSSRINRLDEAMGVAGRDLANRTRGLVPSLRQRFSSGGASDEVLVERVRSRLGRVVSHPGAVEVRAEGGRVILSGPVLRDEHAQLLRTVRAVPGVREVEDHTAVHESSDGVPALQGGAPRPPGQRLDILQEHWSPATRAVMGAAGSALLLNALSEDEHPLTGLLSGIIGAALIVRSTTNVPLSRLAGMAGRRGIDVHKTIHVNAPVEQVFETLARYESFPQFMTNVREVRLREDGVSHWVVAGPGGIPVEWDAVTTRMEPNRLLSWETVPGSTVEHAGTIRFRPDDGGTRLDIEMSYRPPAGALGHVVARLFGADPKSEFDQDLLRFKTFLETGRPAHDAAAGLRH